MASRSDTTIVARRYASAAFELAEEASVVQKVILDLDSFRASFHESSELRHLILSPNFPLDVKKNVMSEIFAEHKLHPLSHQILNTLLDNGRVSELDEICRIYDSLQFERGYKKTVTIRSASPLTADQEARLNAAIHAKLARDITLEIHTDPALIAGIVVELGGVRIDSTLKTKLDKLVVSMKGAHA